VTRPRSRRDRRSFTRLLASLAVLSLLALSIGPSFLLAANTRNIYFGTPESLGGSGGGFDNDGNPVSGTLVFSPVTTGGKTMAKLLIRNDGNQTINHIKFAGGDVADELPYNAGYPAPTVESFGGSSLAAIFPSTGCDPAGPDGLMCDVGTLGSGDSRLYTLVFTPPATAGTYDIWLTVSWNEGWSTTGSNADYAFAEGSIVVAEADCDTPTANYFLPNELVSLANGGGKCDGQSASVSAGALGGLGGFGTLGIDEEFDGCPDGYSCFGNTVSVSISDGIAVPGGVEWSLRWEGTKSLKGVIHFHDDYDPADTDTYDVILFQKKFQCSNKLTTNCWVSTASSKGNVSPWWFEAVIVTDNNGKAGGFI